MILPHDSSNEGVAKRYGYLDSFRSYTQAKEREQAKFSQSVEAANAANEAEDAERKRQQAAEARQALLSP